MRIAKRIGLLLLFTLAGAVGMCLFTYASLGGAFIPAYSFHRADGGETGLGLVLFPFLGALIGFVLGLAVLLYILFLDFVGWLQKRAQEKKGLDES